MGAPDRACPDYPNECMHPWAHARTYAEVKATQPSGMTDQELEEIELRALAATREPWHVEYLGDHGYPQRIANDAAVVVATTYEGTQPAGNAEFIAAARTDIVRLIAEVRRLKAGRS